jgi:rhamnogalacturonyl hydrolase YesR
MPMAGMVRAALLALVAIAWVAAPRSAIAADLQAPLAAAERLADWQLAHMDAAGMPRNADETADPRSWIRGAFWIGLTAIAERRPAKNRFTTALLAMGRANGWEPGSRLLHADDQAIAQAYLWSAEHGAGTAARLPTMVRLDAILAHPPRVHLAYHQGPGGYDAVECLARWCWCDALFMAPPTWLALSRQTGDPRYARHALDELWATVDFLYDPAERLFFRDSRFFERRDSAERKLFWARGNGWVFAGLARMLPLLPPASPDRRRMEALFQEMAARLVGLQKPDGYWSPSLLAPEGSPPESSGTGFFTYGLAWGIRAGLLDRATYEEPARRGWTALLRAIQPDGRLGWVQQVSDRPEHVAASDTQLYGTGAFLLAATAIADLDAKATQPKARP